MSATTTLPTATYGVDPVHSTIGFGVKYNGIATFRSTFDAFDAQFADGVLTGTAQVDSIAIDNADFKAHVLAEDFFNAEAAPTLTFRSTSIEVQEDGTAVVAGDLTLRGVTKPVTATGVFAAGADLRGNERVAFELTTTTDRREFEINWQAPLPTGGDAVAWDVTLTVDLQLVKAA